MFNFQDIIKPQLLLLGGFDVRYNHLPINPFPYVKMRALLAYLAMEPREHSREFIAELLWPDSDLATSRGNLRRTLADLRRVLPNNGEGWFAVTKNTIQFAMDAWVDAKVIVDACNAYKKVHVKNNNSSLSVTACLDIYKGEFLAGLVLTECFEYENWLLLQRESLHRSIVGLLEQEISICEQANNIVDALIYATHLTSMDPWNENYYIKAMRLCVLDNQYGTALSIFDSCEKIFKRELGMTPSILMQELAEQVRKEYQNTGLLNFKKQQELSLLKNLSIFPKLVSERRQVTVVYCELVPPQDKDPDDMVFLLKRAQEHCTDKIIHSGGHVIKVHGSGGLLAYFGYPHAHEHAARHAVKVGLALTEIKQCDVRVAVHTGLIITDSDSVMPDAIGHTSKMTIQMRHSVKQSAVVISEPTYRLIENYFNCEKVDFHEVFDSSILDKTAIYRVKNESILKANLRTRVNLTPFVGRQKDIDFLYNGWSNISSNKISIQLILAGAGLGKSRILHEFASSLKEKNDSNIYELRCFPEYTQTPFYPLITLIETLAGIDQQESVELQSTRLHDFLCGFFNDSCADYLLLIKNLLSMPDGMQWASGFSPQKIKEKTTAILLDILRFLSFKDPALLIIEDLHWMDHSSLELLTTFISQQKSFVHGSMMVVLTARPEFNPVWQGDLYNQLTLNPLPKNEIEMMVLSLSKNLSKATAQNIVEKADGIPLFVEELVKVSVEDKILGVPSSLHDVLMARIDHLGSAKYTAQLAACLGREFRLEILEKITLFEIEVLNLHLSQLRDAGIIFSVNNEVWQFKHALVQDAAYALQTKNDRQNTHRRIAKVLEDEFSLIAEAKPELLAQHWAAAGEEINAITSWIKAGQRATRASAIHEAMGHFKAALDLLNNILDESVRNCNEFAIWTNYSPVLYAVYGYGSAEASQANKRIAELSEQVGDSPELFFGKWSFVMNTIATGSAPNGGALVAAEQLLASPIEDPIHKQAAFHAIANAAFWCGRFDISLRYAREAIGLFQPEHRPIFLQQCGTDLSIFSMSYEACSLFFMGAIDSAEALCEEKLIKARATGHPHTLAQALSFASTLYRWIGKPQRVLELSEETISLSREHDFSLWLACGEMTHGWSLVRLGNPDLGFAKLHASVAGMRMTLCGIPTVFISALAEAYLYAQQYNEGLALLDEALDNVTKVGDGGLYHAEILRLKGECLLTLSANNLELAGRCFDQALAIANTQSATTLVSRIQVSKGNLAFAHSLPND